MIEYMIESNLSIEPCQQLQRDNVSPELLVTTSYPSYPTVPLLLSLGLIDWHGCRIVACELPRWP